MFRIALIAALLLMAQVALGAFIRIDGVWNRERPAVRSMLNPWAMNFEAMPKESVKYNMERYWRPAFNEDRIARLSAENQMMMGNWESATGRRRFAMLV